ncbi:MAG: sodium:solute symporter [Thermoanaerobaculia bacterium]
MSLGGIDAGLLVAYLTAVVLFGLRVGRRSPDAADYMVGQRDFPWWLLLASIVATETSTVTFLSIPGFSFGRDLTWLQIPIGFLLGRAVVAWILLPRYFEGSYFTAYEVLTVRFGDSARRAASALFIVTRTLADGLRLFLTALVLEEMTGLDFVLSVVLMGAATIAYTWSGGIRAVLWTDLVQLAVYLSGALIAFFVLLERIPGGWSEMMAIGSAAGRLRVFDLSFSPGEPYALWAGVLGGIFVTLGSHGVDQMMVQRYLCARDLRSARKALVGGGFVVFAQFALFLLIGVALYAFYQLHPPAAPFERTDRVFVRFILDELPVGLVGILLGAIFAAAMSTLSSSLNSCATTWTRDLRPRRDDPDPAGELRATRLATVVFGGLQVAVGIGGLWLRSTVVASVLGIAAFTTGIVLGVFLLGMYAPRAGERAALAGLVTGFAAMTAIFFLTPLAWPWYALVGSAITFAAGWSASFAWPRTGAAPQS